MSNLRRIRTMENDSWPALWRVLNTPMHWFATAACIFGVSSAFYTTAPQLPIWFSFGLVPIISLVGVCFLVVSLYSPNRGYLYWETLSEPGYFTIVDSILAPQNLEPRNRHFLPVVVLAIQKTDLEHPNSDPIKITLSSIASNPPAYFARWGKFKHQCVPIVPKTRIQHQSLEWYARRLIQRNEDIRCTDVKDVVVSPERKQPPIIIAVLLCDLPSGTQTVWAPAWESCFATRTGKK